MENGRNFLSIYLPSNYHLSICHIYLPSYYLLSTHPSYLPINYYLLSIHPFSLHFTQSIIYPSVHHICLYVICCLYLSNSVWTRKMEELSKYNFKCSNHKEKFEKFYCTKNILVYKTKKKGEGGKINWEKYL